MMTESNIVVSAKKRAASERSKDEQSVPGASENKSTSSKRRSRRSRKGAAAAVREEKMGVDGRSKSASASLSSTKPSVVPPKLTPNGNSKDKKPSKEKKAVTSSESLMEKRKKSSFNKQHHKEMRDKKAEEKKEDNKELSGEGVALLEGIKTRADPEKGIRTGKISMSELMGGGDQMCPELRRLRLASLNSQSLLNTAFAHMPQVPGFPSLTHRPDPGPYSTAFRPELFKTTMEAYASASMAQLNCQDDGGFGNKGSSPLSSHSCGRFSPDQLLPWVSFAPMYPLDPNASVGGATRPIERASAHTVFNSNEKHVNLAAGLGGGYNTKAHMNNNYSTRHHNFAALPQVGPSRNSMICTQQHQGYSESQNGGAHSSNSTASHSQIGVQKTRKPFFMPYLSKDAVSRGIASGELIKGQLRVNQRNYEESYVDNPEGDDQLDLLVLGIHDRNRALHGDVVVVRMKPREEWLLRNNLYDSWRKGKLNLDKDENGLPLSVPPVALEEPPLCVELLSEMVSSGVVAPKELVHSVELSKESVYDKKAMLIIAHQMREGEGPTSTPGAPSVEIQRTIAFLSIGKSGSASCAAVASSPLQSSTDRGTALKRMRPNAFNLNGRRPTHRLLCEMPDEDWGVPDICLQKTVEVVYIAEQRNCRAAMGQLKVMADGNRNWALFSPTDSRMPRMLIPHEQLPLGFFDRPHDYARFIFVARMEEWQATAQFARGKLERTLGEAGDIEAEMEGLLFSNDIDTREFSAGALASLPFTESDEWKIDEMEFKYRKDLREKIIFSIDPETARDLDDALSIEKCEDVDGKGTPGWEVGVHIADVTYFLRDNTELDRWAAHRATSVYLVHKVIPMLPRILCEQLCSLNPGVDRLAFSVIWKMDNQAKVYDTWFGRSIIRSCCKMSYQHAEDIIKMPGKLFVNEELPPIFNSRTIEDLKAKTLQLYEITKQLRAQREENGSLRLDQPKLKFAIDEDTKLPFGVCVYERMESCSLVEELMLLANQYVARKIEDAFPKTALLRRHPPPKQKIMREVIEMCANIGFPLDAVSSKVLSSELHKFSGDKQVQAAINQVLSTFLMKPMQNAQYFCTGVVACQKEYHHYALNMDYYTHFTSPIRRYADVMVHRLLAAAIGYAPPPSLSPDEVERQAVHCNEKKQAAKDVSDKSDETFFGLFVKQCGPLCEKSIVVNVLDAAFDVLVLKYGVIKRVYVNRLDMARDPVFESKCPANLTLFWNPGSGKPNTPIEQVITICSVVDVCLTALPEPTKYQAVIKMCPRYEQKTLHDLLQEKRDDL